MGFLKNYVANMGQIAKKLRKSSIYGAALKLCSLLVTLGHEYVVEGGGVVGVACMEQFRMLFVL